MPVEPYNRTAHLHAHLTVEKLTPGDGLKIVCAGTGNFTYSYRDLYIPRQGLGPVFTSPSLTLTPTPEWGKIETVTPTGTSHPHRLSNSRSCRRKKRYDGE
jgi:hypothetical protein